MSAVVEIDELAEQPAPGEPPRKSPAKSNATTTTFRGEGPSLGRLGEKRVRLASRRDEGPSHRHPRSLSGRRASAQSPQWREPVRDAHTELAGAVRHGGQEREHPPPLVLREKRDELARSGVSVHRRRGSTRRWRQVTQAMINNAVGTRCPLCRRPLLPHEKLHLDHRVSVGCL